MNTLLAVFVLTTALFALLMVIKTVWLRRLCVICGAVSLTWLILLGLSWLGLFHNPVLLALLMGESVTGVYYLIEKRVPANLFVFRLPFLLTLTVLAYSLISFSSALIPVCWLLLGLWLAARVILASRLDPAKPSLANALINCCGDRK